MLVEVKPECGKKKENPSLLVVSLVYRETFSQMQPSEISFRNTKYHE